MTPEVTSEREERAAATTGVRAPGREDAGRERRRNPVPLDRTPPPTRVPLHSQVPLLIGLVVLWLILWQHVDLISVVSGIVFALFVVRVFYLPPVLLADRFHLGWFLVLAGRMLWWILRASAQVAWLSVRPKPVPRSAIVKTHLHTDSDWLQTLAAEVNMLVPGSVVVEVDRRDRLIFLHVLDADSDEKVEAARRMAFEIEVAIAMAFGSWRELVRISEACSRHGRAPLPGIERARTRARLKHEARPGASRPGGATDASHSREGGER